MTPEQILAGLDEEQRQAVLATKGPVCIIAGAGTGKTRTVTHRIAYAVLTGTVAPEQVLAVTHSQKAAGEMRARLRQLGVGDVTARTFHSAALKQLRYFWGHTGRSGQVSIMANRYTLVRRSLERFAKSRADVTNELVLDVTGEIGWAKSQLLAPAEYPAAARRTGRKVSHPLEDVAKAYGAYEEMKDESGQVDFEDVLRMTAELIEDDPYVAEQVRSAYSYFVVDEYQDTDPLQHKLLKAWLGDRDDVCVVGDPRQAIYSWKGADPELIEGFTKEWKGAKVTRLVKDYRSTPEVVHLANSIFASTGRDRLQGMRPSGPRPEVQDHAAEGDEEKWVAKRTKELIASGVPASEIAILYRFNAQSARFEQALASVGVPYVVSDTEKFYDRPEVRSVLIAFGKAAREEPDEVGAYLLRLALAEAGWDRDNPPKGAGAARDRWEALAALLSIVESMPDCETLAAQYLLSELQHRAMEQHAPSQATVTLSTVHKAKGLEWDAVFVVRCTEGSIPSAYSTTPAQVEEEKRLLYVAATRAREHLYLTWSAQRENGWSSKPSRFLVDLGLATNPSRSKSRTSASSSRSTGGRGSRTEEDPFWDSPMPKGAKSPIAQAKAAPATRTTSCEACGAKIGTIAASRLGVCAKCLTGADLERYQNLVLWRDEAAKTDGLSVWEVLSDDAVLACVASRPKDLTELGRIPSIDPVKRRRWGRAIVYVVA